MSSSDAKKQLSTLLEELFPGQQTPLDDARLIEIAGDINRAGLISSAFGPTHLVEIAKRRLTPGWSIAMEGLDHSDIKQLLLLATKVTQEKSTKG